ncbi:DUF4143 domain-containing protein [Occultella kanbiaonis]|uniref:DUF4143 domain-containing protein n=1 Tax=Occultella kanbiaonis TaxID=2675754 RepID=UPI003F49060F
MQHLQTWQGLDQVLDPIGVGFGSRHRLVHSVGRHHRRLSWTAASSSATIVAWRGPDCRVRREPAEHASAQDLRIIDRVPAWHTSRFSRPVRTPKCYVMVPGRAARLVGVDREAALRSGDVLGRLIDAFVTAQIRPLLALGTGPVSLSHLRDRGGATAMSG